MILFDTSVIIDQIRSNRHAERMAALHGNIRISSVVLAELWRGAINLADRKTLEALEANYPILTPTEELWLDSGRVLAEMKRKQGFEPHKLRDLHFDVLIALTARAHGARLITSNRADFEMIRGYREFGLEIW